MVIEIELYANSIKILKGKYFHVSVQPNNYYNFNFNI
jgi:hypothetical protein